VSERFKRYSGQEPFDRWLAQSVRKSCYTPPGGVSVSESACTEQLAGVDVLLYGTDRPATDVFQAQGLLEPAVVGFNAPAPVIQVGKELGGEGLGVQERGGQHFRFPGGQRHPPYREYAHHLMNGPRHRGCSDGLHSSPRALW